MHEEFSSPEFQKKLAELDAEARFLEERLKQYLNKDRAENVAREIYSTALDAEEAISEILRDQEVLQKYDYDGTFFSPKGGSGWGMALDGTRVLQAFNKDNLGSYFKGGDFDAELANLRKKLDEYRWLAKRRLISWQKEKTLSLVDKETIAELARIMKKRREEESTREKEQEIPPLSAEETNFLAIYEEEMKRYKEETRDGGTRG